MKDKIACDAGRWDKPCKIPATISFEDAPKGTAHPARQIINVCSRHQNMILKGTYPYGNFIRTSPFRPLKEG